jgi:hypothetical protein
MPIGRQHYFVGSFVATLAFCSVMVMHQFRANQVRHTELREAFVLLHTRGYGNEARRVYARLLREVAGLSDRALLDDFQRTLMLVDPSVTHTQNLIWDYHWTVSNELERRSAKALHRALKLAEGIK